MRQVTDKTPARASWIELDAAAWRRNHAAIRSIIGSEVGFGVVLKGGAYGHGLDAMLTICHADVDAIDVVTAQEALQVRRMERDRGWPRRPVLVIGALDAAEAKACARADVSVVVSDGASGVAMVSQLTEADPPLQVHVHIDTGLCREGFLPDALAGELDWLEAAGERVVVSGVLTHFADTEDVTEQSWALHQLERFDAGRRVLVDALAVRGRPTELAVHTAASAPAMLLPQSRHTRCRVGIAAYGLWPSRETKISWAASGQGPLTLSPVLSWRVRSQLTKWVPAGSYVGYGCSYRCADDTRVAVLPVGYHDGYPRRLSNQAHVLVDGRRCPVIGRVMMNHIIVDITRVSGASDSVEAVLIGRSGDDEVTADDLAGWAQTINYEIVTRLGAHLRRVVRNA